LDDFGVGVLSFMKNNYLLLNIFDGSQIQCNQSKPKPKEKTKYH